MSKIQFSVLMSVYHKEKPKFLNESLKSIYNQSLVPNEVVLVKDGPLNAELDEIIKYWELKFKDVLKVVILSQNNGLSKALNEGLKVCSFDWVFRMDTDDICIKDRFEKLVNFIEKNSYVDIVGSWAIVIDEFGNQKDTLKVPVSTNDINKLIWTCPMIHPTVAFKKISIIKIGSYNPQSGPRQDDYELWYRCVMNRLIFSNIPEPLLYYRFTSENMKRNNITVGWHTFKTGFKGNMMIKAGPIAYIGVFLPLLRSLLPYPLNIGVYKLVKKLNPRNKEKFS